MGRYEIVKHLASGGMADVLLARDGAHHVVLKRIRAEQANDERYVAMFLEEARVASALHHPNVVEVHDVGQDRGEQFFTMEYVHGEDARRLLTALSKRDEQIPVEHVVAIVMAAAAGLHHAHAARGADGAPLGIIHRDVSPANLLIGYDGTVKVADFGIAKARQRNVETEAGALKGKVAYMSPEQCVGEAMDHRSDVFSLGIVLYELLTVRRLFKGDNDFLTMTSIVLGHIPPPSKYRADLPEDLEAILFRALENKPVDRYQTADELRRALAEFAAAHGLAVTADSLAAYMKQVFGTRPMPWDDHEDEVDLSVDFDGSASGVVAPVVDARTGKIGAAPPIAEAPTAILPAASVAPRARTAPPPEPVPVLLPVLLPEPVPVPLPSASLTMAIAQPRRRSRWWALGGGLAVVVAGTALALIASRSPAEPAPRPTAAPVRVAPPPPPAEPIVPPNLAATTMSAPAPAPTPPPAKRGSARKRPSKSSTASR